MSSEKSKLLELVLEAGFPQRFDSLLGGKASTVVAELTGISHESIRRYRNGLGAPNLYNMIIIKNYYKTSLDWLIFGDEKPRRVRKIIIEEPVGGILEDGEYLLTPIARGSSMESIEYSDVPRKRDPK